MSNITFKKEPSTSEFGTQNDFTTVTVEFEDIGIQEIVEDFRCFLLAIGYHPETIEKYLDIE